MDQDGAAAVARLAVASERVALNRRVLHVVGLAPIVFGAEADGGHAAVLERVPPDDVVVALKQKPARARVAEMTPDDAAALPVGKRVAEFRARRHAQDLVQCHGRRLVAVVFEGRHGRLGEKALVARNAGRLADLQPRPTVFHGQRVPRNAFDGLERAVDGNAVVQKDALEHAVLDVRAGVGARRVQAVGGVGHERVFGRPRRARPEHPAAVQDVVPAAALLAHRREAVAHHSHIADRAVAAVVHMDFKARVAAAPDQPVAQAEIAAHVRPERTIDLRFGTDAVKVAVADFQMSGFGVHHVGIAAEKLGRGFGGRGGVARVGPPVTEGPARLVLADGDHAPLIGSDLGL